MSITFIQVFEDIPIMITKLLNGILLVKLSHK